MRSFTLANVLRLLLGFWFVYSASLGAEPSSGEFAVESQLIGGGCIVILAAMRFIFVQEAGFFRWAHLLLGAWMIAAPWVFDYVDNGVAFWNSAICGSLLAVLAAWSLVR